MSAYHKNPEFALPWPDCGDWSPPPLWPLWVAALTMLGMAAWLAWLISRSIVAS